MIVIGYQGIGKTTICRKKQKERTLFKPSGYIDLESGLFKNEQGERPDNWADIYCRIALSLSEQGYTVFVSSHKAVQDILKTECGVTVIAVYPSLSIKEDWIARLYVRWKESGLNKDKIAYLDAEENYEAETDILRHSGLEAYEIDSMVYSLEDIVSKSHFKHGCK